jgi:hypothetical protein
MKVIERGVAHLKKKTDFNTGQRQIYRLIMFFFPIKGVFITQKSSTPGLCITRMHTATVNLSISLPWCEKMAPSQYLKSYAPNESRKFIAEL